MAEIQVTIPSGETADDVYDRCRDLVRAMPVGLGSFRHDTSYRAQEAISFHVTCNPSEVLDAILSRYDAVRIG